MEGNKDEALRCLSIAQKHRNAGNYTSARKFIQKSLALFATPEAEKLAQIIESEASASTSTSTSKGTEEATKATGTEKHPSAGGTHHRHPNGNTSTSGSAEGSSSGSEKKRDYTPDQLAVVKRVRACKVTEYYEILALGKDCEETDVKKAYRKLALALHPDKNGAPGADEAFKMVSKAFQVLSDSNMRAAYDRHGADPESRFSGMSSSSRGPGFHTHSFSDNAFETEVSPEELFNMFFGGSMGGGGGFGTPMFTASFGGPGMTFTTGGTRRRQGQQQQQQGAGGTRGLLMQLAPMLILFLFSILSALPNIFTTPPTPEPRYAFTPSTRYNIERATGPLGIKYHVNSQEFMSHPIAAEIARDSSKRGPQLSKFEESVERAFTRDLIVQCQAAVDRKHRRKEELIGLFGIGTDWEKVRAIDKEPLEACDRLKQFGLS
ncbi:DnaJ-domain-containing protein [Thelephora ganbajun]|uniref:DnaJ-domain-containing protein n=1 Tax=Thelephora ganbajun TaxID=370292 RepID=A0ACB6ZMX3_THEGA|nr:DnaJ-domain-containing protein [Thelephora ganbajun]